MVLNAMRDPHRESHPERFGLSGAAAASRASPRWRPPFSECAFEGFKARPSFLPCPGDDMNDSRPHLASGNKDDERDAIPARLADPFRNWALTGVYHHGHG